ncbi:MAG: endonuclease [Candidatus Methanofishera endochildressiae]|uniref:Endonuclease n=1 Tax=Candidatus Methanofishera endochildressiae TaxID=2738884 RepID=A0A7Z0MMS1_9GAMM|nr:endonuclease [Candidatus Methanofishera endochildressiae]
MPSVSLYAETYSRFKLSAAKKRLFEAWDKQFPVTETECDRNKIIEKLQGNINQILTTRCED